MPSIDTYHAWNVIVPAVISALLWVALFFPMLISFRFIGRLPSLLVQVLQLSLSDIKEDEDCSCVKVGGSKTKKIALKVLALLIIPLTVVTIFFSFWNVWLVEEEKNGACVPNFDCFPMLNGESLQDKPVANCSQVLDSSMMMELMNTTTILPNETGIIEEPKITYKCYRFLFNYAEGIGAAGGVLFFTAVFSKIYFSFIVATEGRDYLRAGTLVVVLALALVVWILFIVVNTAVPVIREAVFQTHTDSIQFFLYAANFLAVVIGGYVVSAGVFYANK
jgi:hypothetical protein